MRIILLLALVVLAGCTSRDVSYHGITYRHRAFLNQQAFGKLNVQINTNGVASVSVENFANDQVSAIREAKELAREMNNLKSP